MRLVDLWKPSSTYFDKVTMEFFSKGRQHGMEKVILQENVLTFKKGGN